MCEGSVYVQHRRATDREELTLKSIPDYGIKGFYQTDKASDRLVCTLPNTNIVIDEVRLQSRAAAHPAYAGLQGKRNVEATLVGMGRSGDSIRIGNANIAFGYFLDGMTIGIGRPIVTLDDKLGLDDKSLRSVSADIEREEPIVEHQMPEHRLTSRRRTFDRADGDD